MKDRVSTQVVNGAIRMEQLDAEGNHLGYIYLKRADEPIVEGTALSKKNVLTDETAAAVGLDPADDPTPNDAFFKLSRLETMQVGDTITTARTIADGRFLACKGQGVSKDDYPELYAAIPERFAFQPTNIAWNAATITDTSTVYAVGDYYIKLKTSGGTQWQISEDGVSDWADLPYTGRMYCSSGYYLLDSGYICTDETSITAESGWKQITYSNDCTPADKVFVGAGDYGTLTFQYAYDGCTYDIKDDRVFVILHYSTDYQAYEDVYTYDEETGEEYCDGAHYIKFLSDCIYVVSADDLYAQYTDFNCKSNGIQIYEHCSYYTNGYDLEYEKTVLTDIAIIESCSCYYLLCTYSSANSKPYKLYSLDSSTWAETLVVESASQLYTNPGKNAVFVEGSYISTVKIYPFSSTVYANGDTITLTVPSSKYIFAIGYDRSTNSIVYVVHADRTTSSTTYPWGTYIYNLDSGKTFELDSRETLLSSADYATVLGEDGDGRVYTANYKLVYDLNTGYVLPLYEDNGDAKYMKVSSYIKAEVIDGVLYVRDPFAYAKITDGVLYANGAFTSAEIKNDTLYVQ